jgi:protein-tyrosine phosphatase
MELFQIDERGHLFISPDIDDWTPVRESKISVVVDLDGALDICIPEVPNEMIYIYFPIEDALMLPDLQKLHSLARLGANSIKNGYRVLSHCGMGHNRSALLAGLILIYLGMTGEDAVALLQRKRQGALYNEVFAKYLNSFAGVLETV